MPEVTNNTSTCRFELEREGHIAFADYRRDGDVLEILHVEAPPALRGTGAASALMQGIMEHVQAENLKLRPLCSYAAAWLKKHEEYKERVA